MSSFDKIRTRIAPSPTGFLHLGTARTALFSWAYARHHGGEFVLRIEDTDVARSTQDSVEQIIQAIKRMDAGLSAADVGRELGVNQYTLYRWKKKYGGLEVSDARRLRQLEDENSKLKRMVAEQALDIDALKIVSEGVNRLRSPDRSMIVITHYQRLLDHIVPDVVHVLSKGRIVKTGGKELALELEAKGYDWVKQAV